MVEPEPGDNRFKDPDWSNGQYFDFWKQAYLITSRWAEDLTRNTEGVDEKTRKKALFYLNQMLAALSPSNFALTNPEVVRTTLATNAENLVQRHVPVRSGPRAVEGSVAHQPDGSFGLRDRTEPGRDPGQGRVPERPHPAHPICADDRRRSTSGRCWWCRRGSTSSTFSISCRRNPSSNGRSIRASPCSWCRGSTPTPASRRRHSKTTCTRASWPRSTPSSARPAAPRSTRSAIASAARCSLRRSLIWRPRATTGLRRQASSPPRSISARPAICSCSSTTLSSRRSRR